MENSTEELKNTDESQPVEVVDKPHKGLRLLLKIFLILLSVVALAVFLFCVPVYIAPAVQTSWGRDRSACPPDSSLLESKAIKKQISKLDADIQKLDKKLTGMIPTTSYIVINTVDNKFFLYKNRQLIRSGLVSTGKNMILTTADGKKEYRFKTPRGCLSINSKAKNPVWARPDWDFIEQGLPVPKPGDPSRFQAGVLGDYKLVLGDGYMIHGTIWKRFIGMPVTHGCVRMNDDDLEAVYNTLNVGSKVYIY